MFCPKCGGSNPDNVKYCRNCGTDLGHLSGVLPAPRTGDQTAAACRKPASLEGAVTRIFTGLAFLIVAIVLGVSGVAGGKAWWFWMLIPAFGSVGTGVAQYMQVRKQEAARLYTSSASLNSISNGSLNGLPQSGENAMPDSRYRTGDLVPPSVTDSTTRHLDKEGQTMTLPKN